MKPLRNWIKNLIHRSWSSKAVGTSRDVHRSIGTQDRGVPFAGNRKQSMVTEGLAGPVVPELNIIREFPARLHSTGKKERAVGEQRGGVKSTRNGKDFGKHGEALCCWIKNFAGGDQLSICAHASEY